MIYRITDNTNDFQDLDIDPFDFVEAMAHKNGLTYSEFERFSWDNKVFGQDWIDIGGDFMLGSKNKPRPELAMWSGPYLMLSPKANKALAPLLAPYGELLPFSVEGDSWHLFNCLTLADVDEARSEALTVDGHWQGVKSLAFPEAEIRNKRIFKTKFNRCTELYCDATLVELIQAHQLTGLEFSPSLIPELL
ncbi:hypothetical protein [Microbulbifer agarilyticus]